MKANTKKNGGKNFPRYIQAMAVNNFKFKKKIKSVKLWKKKYKIN